jgi:predicted nucleic acid-binding protein
MSDLLLVDTDILIDVGREVTAAVMYLGEAEKQTRLAISAITQMELMVGCRNKVELRTLNHFLKRFTIIKLSEEINNLAVELLGRYRLSNGLLIPDALIAATAISTQEQFVTKNRRDFQFIVGLNLLAYL